jgi:hypothetical protein
MFFLVGFFYDFILFFAPDSAGGGVRTRAYLAEIWWDKEAIGCEKLARCLFESE